MSYCGHFKEVGLRLARWTVVLLVLIPRALGQQSQACATVAIPATVVQIQMEPGPFHPSSPAPPPMGVTPVKGLEAPEFTVRIGKQETPLVSATYDTGPRRILLLLDTNRAMSKTTWRILSSIAMNLLSKARLEDSFALMTYGDARINVPFGTDRMHLERRMEELLHSDQKGTRAGRSLMDAVGEGTRWFGRPQLGDAILLLDSGWEPAVRSNPQKLANLLTDQHIRLFVFFAGNDKGEMAASFAIGMPAPYTMVTTLGDMSKITGGYPFHEDTEGVQIAKHYTLTASRLSQLQEVAWEMYQCITAVYVLTAKMPSTENRLPVQVGLSNAARQQTHARVLWPQWWHCVE